MNIIETYKVEEAAANINYVGKAVAAYMTTELGSTEDCKALLESFIEIVDDYLTNLAR